MELASNNLLNALLLIPSESLKKVQLVVVAGWTFVSFIDKDKKAKAVCIAEDSTSIGGCQFDATDLVRFMPIENTRMSLQTIGNSETKDVNILIDYKTNVGTDVHIVFHSVEVKGKEINFVADENFVF